MVGTLILIIILYPYFFRWIATITWQYYLSLSILSIKLSKKLLAFLCVEYGIDLIFIKNNKNWPNSNGRMDSMLGQPPKLERPFVWYQQCLYQLIWHIYIYIFLLKHNNPAVKNRIFQEFLFVIVPSIIK